jgi:signal transduction histidine kinase
VAVAAAVVALVALVSVFGALRVGTPAVVGLLVACAALVVLVRGRSQVAAGRRLGAAAAGTAAAGTAGGTSLLVTLLSPRTGELADDRMAAAVTLAEVGVLLVVLVLAARAGWRWSAMAVVPAAVAVGTWVLRVDLPDSPVVLAGCAAWSCVAGAAVAVGRYLRRLDDRREASVAAARAAQRLELAGELHDVVAHDVSEVLALAQAGQVLAAQDPAQGGARTLAVIETAALRALTSLDRSVELLRAGPDARPGTAPPEDPRQHGLADLAELCDRFAASTSAQVRASLDPPPLLSTVPPRVGESAYRVVLEALTNVRRHAPRATAVEVELRVHRDRLHLRVEDDGGGATHAAPSRAGHGTGLADAEQRVRASGGVLTAGPVRRGWGVHAELPLGAGPSSDRR